VAAVFNRRGINVDPNDPMTRPLSGDEQAVYDALQKKMQKAQETQRNTVSEAPTKPAASNEAQPALTRGNNPNSVSERASGPAASDEAQPSLTPGNDANGVSEPIGSGNRESVGGKKADDISNDQTYENNDEGGTESKRMGQESEEHAENANPESGQEPASEDQTQAADRRRDRDSEYPKSYRKGVREKVFDAYRDEQGRLQDEMGEIVPEDEATLDHKKPVVDHWNEEGHNHNQTAEQRADFYNDIDNLAPKTHSKNSRDGAKLRKRYRQDVGPNYKSKDEKPRKKKP
jgi:hypothetical protein